MAKGKVKSSASLERGILVGTDFSDGAQGVARAAAAMARRLKEPLHLAHAVDVDDAEVLKLLTSRRRKDLHREALLLRETGARLIEHVPAGRPDEALVELSLQSGARLLMVSSLGKRGPERWLLGSVAERAAERTTVPMLVVRESKSLVSWAEGERPLRVFACFNFTATSEAVLKWVKSLQAFGPCEIVLGLLYSPAEESARLGLTLDECLASPDLLRSLLERELKARASHFLGKTPVKLRVEASLGRVDDRLAQIASEERADVLAIGSHQYRGFERFWHSSISRGVLHRAEMSVAIVPLASERGADVAVAPVRRVLVTTDFSELGNAAIPHAYSLLCSGGVVQLLHVIQSDAPAARSRAQGLSKTRSGLIEASAGQLRGLVPAGAVDHRIHTQFEVVESSDVAEAICQSAERFDADVICIGSHGSSGLSAALLGSVAHEVLNRSRRPMFVIRPPKQ